MEAKKSEELVRRLAAALRGTELYAPTHPLVQRGIDALSTAAIEGLQSQPSVVIAFIGDEIVVDATRLPKGSATMIAFARDLRERDVEKITFMRGLTREEIRGLVAILSDRKSLVPLTALKKYDNYTFTHMVNVSALAMAQARALNVEGNLLREFGFAALMHDIGKVNTPLEVLNKPDKLTREEFDIMKRHVVDG